MIANRPLKHFLAVTLVCITVITTLCTCVVVLPRLTLETEAEIIPGLGVCNGVPCYWGITPGATSFEDAREILISDPLQAVEKYPTAFALPNFRTNIEMIGNSDIINELAIHLDSTSVIVAGNIIRQFGSPCYIVPTGSILAIKYKHLAIFLTLFPEGSAWVLRPYSHVREIRLLGGAAKDCLPVDNRTIFGWRGFTQY